MDFLPQDAASGNRYSAQNTVFGFKILHQLRQDQMMVRKLKLKYISLTSPVVYFTIKLFLNLLFRWWSGKSRQQIQVPVLEREVLEHYYSAHPGGISEKMICAGFAASGGKDVGQVRGSRDFAKEDRKLLSAGDSPQTRRIHPQSHRRACPQHHTTPLFKSQTEAGIS